MSMDNFGKYIVYVDESGDHSLASINQDYPIFVLAFCIFEKDKYSTSTVRKIKEFKFKHFGHDMVVLHENEIRRDKGWFSKLNTKDKKEKFIEELTDIIAEEEFAMISTVIDKTKLTKQYIEAKNPYNIALTFCMERLYKFLEIKNEHNKITHIVVEQRGKREDEELELVFRRICDGKNFGNIKFNFDICLASKLSNSAGLQLADLVARPIGLSIIKPTQYNRAFEVLKTKFHKNKSNQLNGVGLKIFP